LSEAGNGGGTPVDKGATATVSAKYTASIFCSPNDALPDTFVHAAKKLQGALNLPLWFLVQNDHELSLGTLNQSVYDAFFKKRNELEQGKIALLIDSPGGFAKSSYQIARLFQAYSKGFVAVVPAYAKSAATLLTLGADKILMTKYAE